MTTKTHEIKLDGYGAHTTLAEDRPIMLLGTAESYGIETLHVVSSKSWEGLTITATFNASDGSSTDILMDTDGNVVVPSEATAKSGSGRIVFTGVSNGIQRISCDLEYFVVAHSAINGVQSGGTAPSWFEQAVTRFMPAGGTAGQVLTKVTDTDFNAEWQDSQGGAGLAPLVGTTQTITSSQVLAAIKAGRDVALQYEDSYYGTFVFSAFNANEKLGIVVSNSILPQWDGLTGTLMGFVEDDTWIFKATNTATKDDVGTAVNEALTAAKASGEFDGADGKSAYSYAQDGGYTGTETEFAAKLAAESIDKALFVVNITTTDGVTYSADKTFDEITQAYNEGKYNIVAVWDGLIMPLSEITESVRAIFGCISGNDSFLITITYDNKVREEGMMLATIHEKLPNPYPLTFTGAVNETYDGSSAKTIEIPSGGGGSAWHTIGTQKMDGVEAAVSFDLDGETIIQIIVTANWNEALTATKATVSLTLANGETVQFTPQTMNASPYSPKNIFTIFGNSKQCRQMIFSKAEGAIYSSVQGSFGVAYGYEYYSEHMVEDKIATGITITFDKAPSNAAVVKVEGM